VSFWSDVEATFDIGSVDPEAIYDSASACRTLSSDMIVIGSALDKAAMGLEKSWKSLGDAQDKSGSAAFQKTWLSFSTSIKEYAGHLDTLAANLHSVGDAVKYAQVQMAHLKDTAEASLAIIGIAAAVTAGGALAGAQASVMADVTVATGLMTEMEATLGEAAAIVDALLDALMPVVAMFAMGAGWDVATIFGTRLAEGLNPFDPAAYGPSDWSNVLLSGDLSLIWGFVAKIPAIKGAVTAEPILGKAAYQFISSATGGPFWQILILGLPANSPATWAKIFGSAGISGLTGAGVGAAGMATGSLGNVLNTESGGPPGNAISAALSNMSQATGVTRGDWVRNGVSLPASVLKYALYGASAPAGLGGPEVPASPLAVPVPDVPLPQVPGLPQGSTLHVVQHEENLSEIASGNAALAREIAQLNRLSADSVVHPGQVLIVPPAGTK
jgi:uncharacterized protein YukE/LysM repeat protein